jgi:hypothetical protein
MTAPIRMDRSWASLDGGTRSRKIRFCSRCGQPGEEPAGRDLPFARTRVCRECGMGMLLNCEREALPGVGASFAVVTADLCVSAVSGTGEMIFGPESDVVGVPLLDLLSSPLGDDTLARTVAQAALRRREPAALPVRSVAGVPGIGTMAARISTCGPPRAALITIEPSEFGRR